jgi:hypothetical protein
MASRPKLFQREVYENKGHNKKNLSWVKVSVKIISLAQKPNTTEELFRDQSCLFQWEEYKDKENHENMSWFQAPVEMISVPQ